MKKSPEHPTKLLWLDLEMTNVDPTSDRIVEVAAIVTDFKLNELYSYESAINHNEEVIKPLLAKNSFWSERPEEMAKILDSIRHGKPESEVERDLVTVIEKTFLPGETVYLAGSSVRVDRSFIDAYFPKVSAMLHYRMLDVTAFKLWWLGTGRQEFLAPKAHRALDDIRRSIAELRFYTSQLKDK